jgi:hypothetical protein
VCSDVRSLRVGSAERAPHQLHAKSTQVRMLRFRVYRVLPSIFQPGLPRWTSSQISIKRGVSLEGTPTNRIVFDPLRQFLVTGSDRAHSCALPRRRASGASTRLSISASWAARNIASYGSVSGLAPLPKAATTTQMKDHTNQKWAKGSFVVRRKASRLFALRGRHRSEDQEGGVDHLNGL